jgi:hypothetical protein
MPSEDNDNAAYVGFRTSDEWTLAELETFIRAVKALYNALLSARMCREVLEKQAAGRALWLLAADEFDELGPTFLPLDWRRWRRVAKRLASNDPGPPLEQAQLEERLEEIISRPEMIVPEVHQIRIRRMRMSSPGGFNFTGLAEIVREFRECVAHVLYRGRQEKALGDLDLLAKWLAIAKENPGVELPVPPYLKQQRLLNDQALKGIQDLRQLEARGKVLLIAENLDYDPDADGPPSQRRKR